MLRIGPGASRGTSRATGEAGLAGQRDVEAGQTVPCQLDVWTGALVDDVYGEGFRDGWQACVAAMKSTEHQLAAIFIDYAEVQRTRWRLRGERRTRVAFGQPHSADYRGLGKGGA